MTTGITYKFGSTLCGVSALALLLGGCASLGGGSNDKNRSKYPSAKLSGRVQLDYSSANAKRSNVKYDDVELRRARLGLGGKLSKRVSYDLSGSIDDAGDIGLVGATIGWEPKGTDLEFTVGQFKTPMSLDETTSSKYISTLERASFTSAIEISRRLGVGVTHSGKRHTISAGVFGGNIETQPFASGRAIAARATYTPIAKKKQTLHLGGSFRHRTNNKDEGQIRYRQRPYAHVAERIISTGRIADSDTSIVGEAAYLRNNLWVAGEYNITNANCTGCRSNPSFKGYYAETGIVVGGRKTYKNGSFGRPKVDKPVSKGGYGAFAVVARYDELDLNNKDVDGGDMKNVILGADWWPTDRVRIGANYFSSKSNLGESGSGIGVDFNDLRRSNVSGESVNGTTIRVQYDF